MVGNGGVPAIAGDGSVVAFPGAGTDLLRVWNPIAGGGFASVCSAENPNTPPYCMASLSADGQVVAVGVGSNLRVFRRADGVRVMNLPMGTPLTSARIQMSPGGGFVAIAPTENSTSAVYAVPSGAQVTSLSADSSGWLDFLFTPADDKLYSVGKRSGDFGVDTISLASPMNPTSRALPAYSTLLGWSAGCPVLYAANLGAWRSCGGCDDTPIAAGPTNQGVFGRYNAVLSGDGMFVAVAGPYSMPGVTLWRLRPDPAELLTIPPRDEPWELLAYPVAITPGGTRILIGATERNSICYSGPAFEVYVHDATAGGAVIDRLPPGLSAVDATARTIASGTQLWCAQ